MNGWWKRIDNLVLKYGMDFLFFLAVVSFLLWLATTPAFGDMIEVGPVRQPRAQGVLGELESRLSTGEAASYPGNPDTVSTAHGLAHDLNGAVRNREGGTNKVNAAYMPGGHSFLFPEPSNLTLLEVRNNTVNRGRWQLDNEVLYGVVYQGKRREGWNHQPLYLIDELSAYCCGAVAGIENGSRERAMTSIGFAEDVYEHCLVMARLARLRGYPHANELDAFLRYAGEYIEQLTFQALDPGVEK